MGCYLTAGVRHPLAGGAHLQRLPVSFKTSVENEHGEMLSLDDVSAAGKGWKPEDLSGTIQSVEQYKGGVVKVDCGGGKLAEFPNPASKEPCGPGVGFLKLPPSQPIVEIETAGLPVRRAVGGALCLLQGRGL